MNCGWIPGTDFTGVGKTYNLLEHKEGYKLLRRFDTIPVSMLYNVITFNEWNLRRTDPVAGHDGY